jgi:hypothetical protein
MADPMSKALRTWNYLVRLTPEEKAILEQRCRIVAAHTKENQSPSLTFSGRARSLI